MKQTKIEVVKEATIREAFAYAVLYSWVFWRNIWRNVNEAAHRLPWLFIGATITISAVTSFVMIGKARAERDHYDHKMVTMQRQLDSYRALCEGKEVRP